MATYNLGQVAIVSKGNWITGTAYAVLNTVYHNGGSFMAIAANTSVEPGVTSGWESSWVSMALGIKTIDIQAVTTSTARAIITLSDGTTVTGSTYNTAAIATDAVATANIQNNAVTTAKIANGAVTAAKQGFVKFGTTEPTTADISEGEIYLMYEA